MAEPSSSRGIRKRPRSPNDNSRSSPGRTENSSSLEDNLIFSDTLIALQLMRTQFPKLEKGIILWEDTVPVPQGAKALLKCHFLICSVLQQDCWMADELECYAGSIPSTQYVRCSQEFTTEKLFLVEINFKRGSSPFQNPIGKRLHVNLVSV